MPRLGSLASKAAPARPPSSDPCVARRQYAACASMQVRHSRRSAAARHARERARACTSAWKSTSRRPSTSASARPCRARHAASPSPSRRTAVSDSSSVHSATTVQMEPPIQPYSEAFCHLPPGAGSGCGSPDPGRAAPRRFPPATRRPGAVRADAPTQPCSAATCRRRWARRRRTACCPGQCACRAVRLRGADRLPARSRGGMPTCASLRGLQSAAGRAAKAPGRRASAEAARRCGCNSQDSRMGASRTRRTPAARLPPTRHAHRRCRPARRCGLEVNLAVQPMRVSLGRAPLHRLLVGEDAGLAGPDDVVRAKVHGHQHLLELRHARAPGVGILLVFG